jgi:helicase
MRSIELIDCLDPLRPEQITDQTLITAVQVTQELDPVYIYLNKKTPKESPSWLFQLRRSGRARAALLRP